MTEESNKLRKSKKWHYELDCPYSTKRAGYGTWAKRQVSKLIRQFEKKIIKEEQEE